MTKKLLAVLLCTLLLGTVAACGSQSGGETGESGDSALDSQAEEPSQPEDPAPQPGTEESQAETGRVPAAGANGQAVISLASKGQSITESGSFGATEGQALTLEVASDIAGGTVDLFLFSPSGAETRFTFSGSHTQEIPLSAGTWAYNCTGFFQSGHISITGTLSEGDGGSVSQPGDAGSQAEAGRMPAAGTNGQAVISLASKGQSITESGSFEVTEGQALTLEVVSDIAGGTVDLFLFSPSGAETRFTFSGNQTEEITLSAGTWSYNCTGFFQSGSISIAGTLS